MVKDCLRFGFCDLGFCDLAPGLDRCKFLNVGCQSCKPKRMFEKVLAVILSTQRSPLAPLKKGGNSLKVPLFKGDLGGSVRFATCDQTFQTTS
jgi:hypothetical protein